jgi:hypothetical protein
MLELLVNPSPLWLVKNILQLNETFYLIYGFNETQYKLKISPKTIIKINDEISVSKKLFVKFTADDSTFTVSVSTSKRKLILIFFYWSIKIFIT